MNPALTRNRSLVLALLALALAVRLVGLDFDQSHFFHPDERRIAEAVDAALVPPAAAQPALLRLRLVPVLRRRRLVDGHARHVQRLVRHLRRRDPHRPRAFGAVGDRRRCCCSSCSGRRLYGARAGLLAGALLAAAVLHVQNSHFATNDMPLTFLVLLALMLLVGGRASAAGRRRTRPPGLAIGLAVATKFSALPLLLPLAVAACLRARTERSRQARHRRLALAVRVRGSRRSPSASRTRSSIARECSHDILEQSRMVRTRRSDAVHEPVRRRPEVPLRPARDGPVGDGAAARPCRVWPGPAGASAGAGRDRTGRVGAPRVGGPVLRSSPCSFDVKFLALPAADLPASWSSGAPAWLQDVGRSAVVAGRAGAGRRGRRHGGLPARLPVDLHPAAHDRDRLGVVLRARPRRARGSSPRTGTRGSPSRCRACRPDRYKVTTFAVTTTPTRRRRSPGSRASSPRPTGVVLQTKRLYGAVTRAPGQVSR